MQNEEQINYITYLIRKAIFEVNRNLGPGLLERAYEEALHLEMSVLGLKFERQKRIQVVYKGIILRSYFVIDFLVDDQVVVELKSVDNLNSLHISQTLTYMKLQNKKLGILVNFNTPVLKDKVSLIRLIN